MGVNVWFVAGTCEHGHELSVPYKTEFFFWKS
jgi:hypothetical protein